MPEYQSPGGAFSSAFEDTLLKQEAGKRQQMLDALAQQKGQRDEQRLQIQDERAQASERRQEELSKIGLERLAEDKMQHELTMKKEQRAEFVKKIGDRLPGDVAPLEDIEEGKRLGLSHLMEAPAPPTAPEPPSAIAAPGLPTPPAQSSAGLGVAATPPMVVRGTAPQRAAIRFGQMSASEPLNNKMAMAKLGGMTYTAADEKAENPAAAKADTEPFYRVTPDKGTLEKIGDLPKGAKVLPEPQPRPEKPEPQGHFSVLPQLDAEGKPTGKMFRVDTRTGTISMAPTVGVEGGVVTKTAPGAAQKAESVRMKAEAATSLDQMDAAVTAAAAHLGPGKGRYQNIAQMMGDPDPTIQALATKMLMGKMQVDHALTGTARASASTGLLQRWDNILALKVTPADLHAGIKAMKEILTGQMSTAPDVTKMSPEELNTKAAALAKKLKI